MKSSETRSPSQRLWYLLWFVLFAIAAAKAVRLHPIFSGGLDLGVSALIGLIAGLQLSQRIRFLNRKQLVLSAVMLLLFCATQFLQFLISLGPPSQVRGVDFSAYYIAAKVLSQEHAESIYQLPLLEDGRMNLNVETSVSSPWHAAAVRYQVPYSAPYIYPPFVAVVMRPMAHLSFSSAYLTWSLLSILMVGAAASMSLRLGGVLLDPKLALILGVGLFSYYPFLDNLFYGQIGGLILFLLAASVWLLSTQHTWPSALCFAVATIIKLTPALAVPILVFHRRWKWLTAYVGSLALLLTFSILGAGWMTHQQFWREVLPSISSGAPIGQNLSIVAFIQELFLGHVPLGPHSPLTLPPHAAVASKLVSLLIYLLMLARFYIRRSDKDVVRDLILITLLGIAISPISWTHHYTIALLPFVYLWCRMHGKSYFTLIALFIVTGTNMLAVLRYPASNPAIQLILAAVTPALTIALVYQALTPEPKRMVRATVFDADVAAIAYANREIEEPGHGLDHADQMSKLKRYLCLKFA